jgi:uncharacterized protein (TIGR02246 family)
MSIKVRIIAIVLALCSIQGCTPTPSAQDTTADIEAIRTFISRATEISRAGDAAAWADLFAEGGIFMPQDQPEATTRQALLASAQSRSDQFNSNIVITPLEIEVFGDWAFARTSLTGTNTPKAGGDAVQIDGKEIAIYRRELDGSWKLWRLIGNEN